MKPFYAITRWIYPLFLGIVIFNCIRIVTDFLQHNNFWTDSMLQHIISQISLIVMCYLYDIKWRKSLKKEENRQKGKFVKELVSVIISIIIPVNIVVFIGEQTGIYYMGNGYIDYLVLNIVSIPLLLLYYVIIRNEIINQNYSKQSLLLEQIKNKQMEAELDYLKAQYHPHFLFNALNTIYFQIDDENQSARKTVELLSELLRYQLYEVNEIVDISDEINFIQSYVQFQSLRMSDRLKLDLHIDPELKELKIYPLLFQPLIENAFKYVGGDLYIQIELKKNKSEIACIVVNSLPEITVTKKKKGIGMDNLKRRLELLYPNSYTLKKEREDNRYITTLIIDIKLP